MVKFTSMPDVQSGSVCFRGTRIPVVAVWEFAADGYMADEIKENFPSLEIGDIVYAMGLVEFFTDA